MANSEYLEQDAFSGTHSWYWRWRRRNGKWGGFQIHRVASVENRGGLIRIAGYGTAWKEGKAPRLDVYVTDAGKRIRVYLDDQEMTVGGDS